MKKIHPRTAAATFIVIYYFIGILISIFTKINLFEIYIIIGVIIGVIIHKIFEKDYYDNL